MNKQDTQQRKQSERWLKKNGVNIAHIYVGTSELFRATKLATITIQKYGRLLGIKEANKLGKFLKATRNYEKRKKITQGQCFKIMNISKQAQRLSAKLNKKQN
jgi:hypothetical protein